MNHEITMQNLQRTLMNLKLHSVVFLLFGYIYMQSTVPIPTYIPIIKVSKRAPKKTFENQVDAVLFFTII